jgi:hypothetical protein
MTKMSGVPSAAARLLAALLLCGAAAAPVAGAATRPLSLGFYDPVYVAAPQIGAPWLQRTVDAGADIVKIDAGWPVAARPANPRDPADPAYDFSRTDRAVRAARARGLRILLSFSGAPAWAEGPGRRKGAAVGTWRPDPAAIGDYGAALARRYSGRYPDPAAPATALPAAQGLQMWNEPNLSIYLTPQWSGRTPASPAHYRRMLRAFYAGVKSVAPRMLVVTAGTAPFGDPGVGGQRMAPARFWRGLLCQTRRLRPAPCSNPARFDVLAHHPYPGGPPRWKEFYADDVSVAGMGKLTRILRAAQRSGRALPRSTRKRVWVTEVSYDSSPPDPRGVPLARHAHYLQQTLYELWRQGVDTITWFRIVDSPPVPSYGDSNQSGIYRLSGKVKPARRAFRFPFVVARIAGGGGGYRAWGRSPVAGRVTIERRSGARWVAVRRITVRRHGTFSVRVSARVARGSLRARVGTERSLAS